jgi:hypothetical protein
MQAYSSTACRWQQLFWLVDEHPIEAAAAVQAGALPVAVAALRTHVAQRAVVLHASRVMLALTCGDAEQAALATSAGAMPALAAALSFDGEHADAATTAAAFQALLSLCIAREGGEFATDAGMIQRASDALHAVLEPRRVFAATRTALREAGRSADRELSHAAARARIELATFSLHACTADADVQQLLIELMWQNRQIRHAVIGSGLPPEAILDVMRAHPVHADVLEGATWLLFQRLMYRGALRKSAAGAVLDDEDDQREELRLKRAVQAAVEDGAVQLVLRACDVLSNANERVNLDWCGHVLCMLSHAGADTCDVILRACMAALRSSDGKHTPKERQMCIILTETVIQGGKAAAAAAASLGAVSELVRALPHADPTARCCMALREMARATAAAKKAVLASGALAACRVQLADCWRLPRTSKAVHRSYEWRAQLLLTIHTLAPRSLSKEERETLREWQN